MTVGEYIRAHGDGELAVILMNFMLSLISIIGVDVNSLNLQKEYYDVLEYVNSPMTPELQKAIDVWNTPSEIISWVKRL